MSILEKIATGMNPQTSGERYAPMGNIGLPNPGQTSAQGAGAAIGASIGNAVGQPLSPPAPTGIYNPTNKRQPQSFTSGPPTRSTTKISDDAFTRTMFRKFAYMTRVIGGRDPKAPRYSTFMSAPDRMTLDRVNPILSSGQRSSRLAMDLGKLGLQTGMGYGSSINQRLMNAGMLGGMGAGVGLAMPHMYR